MLAYVLMHNYSNACVHYMHVTYYFATMYVCMIKPKLFYFNGSNNFRESSYFKCVLRLIAYKNTINNLKCFFSF